MKIYTDGGCSGNPGPGGWGHVILADDGGRIEGNGFEAHTTNNRMELTAAIKALEALGDYRGPVTIYSDSTYVTNGGTEESLSQKRLHWEGIINSDLWQELDKLCQVYHPAWEWIRGHSGNEHNERCDTLAQEAIDQGKKALGIKVAPAKGVWLSWRKSNPPKDRTIMRWHRVWKCAVPVSWSTDKDLESPWLCATKTVAWPEEAFFPEWAECLPPPAGHDAEE